MRRFAAIGFILAAVLEAVSPVRAQSSNDALVRAEFIPDSVVVGRPAILRVTVLVPSWFTSPPVFPSFELSNAITRLPPDSSFAINERVDGASGSGVVRDYLVYPMRAGRYQLAASNITGVYPHPQTQKPIIMDAAVPALVFKATLPSGAHGLTPFIPTTSLAIDQHLSGEVDDLKVGDGLSRTVTARAAGLPSLFLPQLVPAPESSGIRGYPAEARTEDAPLARGTGYDGSRTEAVTYVFEQAGELRLPPVELKWWNTESNAVETASLPAVVVKVTPAGVGDVLKGDVTAA